MIPLTLGNHPLHHWVARREDELATVQRIAQSDTFFLDWRSSIGLMQVLRDSVGVGVAHLNSSVAYASRRLE